MTQHLWRSLEAIEAHRSHVVTAIAMSAFSE
jgi:hypothetical protein